MLIGQTVFIPSEGDPGVVYHGPWMPRQGDKYTAVVELMRQSSGGWSFVLAVETKNAEDADSAASTLGSITKTALGTFSDLSVSGCKELVRHKVSITSSGVEQWLHFRSNPPVWQPN
jgi:hypothetical protein